MNYKKIVILCTLFAFVFFNNIFVMAKDEEIKYLKGLEVNNEVPVFKDENGSFMIEAEDGKIASPMKIFKADNVSNGSYIAVPDESKVNWEDTLVKYQIHITKKGTYKLFLRAFALDYNHNSSWLVMDGGDKLRFDSVPSYLWGWTTSYDRSFIFNLDEGYHTLSINARKSGHRIDRLFLSQEFDYTLTGFGMAPGEKGFDKSEANILKVLVNNDRIPAFATQTQIVNGVFLGSAEAIFKKMSFICQKDETSITIINGRNYAEITDNSSTVVYNGKKFRMPAKAYRYSDAFIVQFEYILDLFEIEYKYDEKDLAFYIMVDKSKDVFNNYREANTNDITIDPFYEAVSYKIPFADESVDCIVSIGAVGSSVSSKQYEPVYSLGAFNGSFGNLHEFEAEYEVKVILCKNGIIDAFKTTFKTSQSGKLKFEDVVPNAKELLLIPTFENISYYINSDLQNATCEIYFRKENGEWQEAFRPFWCEKSKQFRGSIVMLDENTKYEVKAIIKDDLGNIKEEIKTVQTWNSKPKIAKTIPVSELYKGGTLSLEQINGTPDGWIKIVGDGKTVLDSGYTSNETVYVSDSSYLILENLIVKGGYNHGIQIANKSNNIRIINCEISDWGRVGIQNLDNGLYYDYTGNSINNDAGIRIADGKDVLVERCYIHDPRGHATAWTGKTWLRTHPEGPNAIRYRGISGVVIRYNDFIGSNKHRWNDSIESYYNGDPSGGPGANADIYGNMLAYGQDDGIELDGGQMNIRFYNNRIEGFLCGVSVTPSYIGPTYVFRNVISKLGDEFGVASYPFKANYPGNHFYGMRYYINNTAESVPLGLHSTSISKDIPDVGTSYNNIYIANANETRLNEYFRSDSDFDYDLFGSDVSPSGKGSPIVHPNSEKNAVFGLPTFYDREKLDLRLQADSLGVDNGKIIPNFTTSYNGKAPDIGAFESGSDSVYTLPNRPINIVADKYRLNFTTKILNDEVVITIGDIEEGHTYKIRKNNVFDWLNVTNEAGNTEGIITPNSIIKLNVEVNPKLIKLKNEVGAFTFRLDDGFSVPILLYAEGN